MNYIQKVILGQAALDDVDDYISDWHDGDSELPLHEFLGMTREEYGVFLVNPSALETIVAYHREHP